MSPYDAVSSLATIAGLLIILSLVAIKNYRAKINQAFIVFALILTVYVVLSFLSPGTYSATLFVTRLSLLVANFIPISFYGFTLAFIGRKRLFTPSMIIITITGFLMAPIAFLPQAIGAVSLKPLGVNLTRTGPLLWLTLVDFLVVFSLSFYMLLKFRKTSDKTTRTQINLMIYSTAIVVIINMITQIILPEFNTPNYANLVGSPSILLFAGAIGYSILRNKLFDIRVIVLRSFGFLLTLLVVMATFSIIILGPSKILFSNLTLTHLQEAYFITAAVVLALLFGPLNHFLQKITDKLFYQDSYDSDELVNSISKILASEISLDPVCQEVSKVLRKSMHIHGIDIVVLDEGKIYYESGNYYKPIQSEFEKDLETFTDNFIVTDELVSGPLKNTLQKYGIHVAAQLKVKNAKVGYLIFSNKLSGLPYLAKDIRVIGTVADDLAIAIQNSLAYDQIRQFNASLQRKVEESTTQLLIANDALIKANATKDDFISIVSHQLGTPLTAMEGFLSLIIQGFYGKDEAKIDDALKKALSRTRVMKNLVMDLLNISRMSAGKFFLDLSQVNLNDVVKEEISELEVEARDKNVTLTYHPPKHEVPIIQLDEPKTRQAVMNLVNNAIFYSPGKEVDVYLESDQNNVIFKVVDTGIGVPEEQKSKLFTKFFRADNARRESPNGTGIGLYLVKRVVEDQHGKIIFSSTINRGSTFGFSLPISMIVDDQQDNKSSI